MAGREEGPPPMKKREGAPVDMPGTGAAEVLIGRLDEVSALIDDGRLWEASEAVHGRRWLQGVDLQHVPELPLKRAQQWIDAASDVLRSGDVDPHLLQHILLEARRALSN
jgi:hypothetical protein